MTPKLNPLDAGLTSLPTMPSRRPIATIPTEMQHVALGRRRRTHERHAHQREIFRRAEFERDLGERRAEQHNGRRFHRAGEGPRERRDRQRRSGAPLLAIW